MLAGAIGLHSFAEGLSVGQSMATSLAGPGGLVVLGVALHSLVDGAAVAAPVVGQPMPATRVFLLAAIVAGPSLHRRHHRRHGLGGTPGWSCSCSRVAAGTLIYVLRELLRARLEDVGAVGAMWALVVGMLLGLGAELVTELGRSRLDALVPSGPDTCGTGLSPGHRSAHRSEDLGHVLTLRTARTLALRPAVEPDRSIHVGRSAADGVLGAGHPPRATLRQAGIAARLAQFRP